MLCITANLAGDDRFGSKPECLPNARMSALASCGQTAPCAQFCHVPILLQKSFSTADQNFSRPLMRFSDKYVRDPHLLGKKLTGGFANGLGAILNGEHSSASFLSKKSSPGILGLLQQNLPEPDSCAAANTRCGVEVEERRDAANFRVPDRLFQFLGRTPSQVEKFGTSRLLTPRRWVA
jgi:hypothetical protein